MPRAGTPSSDASWRSESSTVDIDLPPPSNVFLKKKNNERKGLKIKLKIPILPPTPPPPPPRILPQHALLTTWTPAALLNFTPPPIICCDRVRKKYSSTLDPDLCHIKSDSITPLLSNFVNFARETTFGRLVDVTATVESKNKFMFVVQRVETGERDMGAPRYFVPVVWEDSLTDELGDENVQENGTGNGMHRVHPRQNEKTYTISKDIIRHDDHISHTLTRSLMSLEDSLEETRLSSSPRTQALTPVFTRTNPWSEDPEIRIEAREEKVNWEDGQLGFREWFVTEGKMGDGEGTGVGVLSDWLTIEDRRGRMDLKCWECEFEWAVWVRERGLTI